MRGEEIFKRAQYLANIGTHSFEDELALQLRGMDTDEKQELLPLIDDMIMKRDAVNRGGVSKMNEEIADDIVSGDSEWLGAAKPLPLYPKQFVGTGNKFGMSVVPNPKPVEPVPVPVAEESAPQAKEKKKKDLLNLVKFLALGGLVGLLAYAAFLILLGLLA